MVEERSYLRWSRTGKYGGALGSENAGMSNHKTGENPVGRKSKVSWAMVIISGLVGPKPRRKSVGDGHQVNIPEPVKFCTLFTVRYSERIHGMYPSNLGGTLREWKLLFGVTILEKALARKADVRVDLAARTANQHRCSSRVD